MVCKAAAGRQRTSAVFCLKRRLVTLCDDGARNSADEGPEGSWVHAYLHRKEGDHGNAAYWYSRAGKPVCREPFDAEWLSIVKSVLN